MNNLRYFLRMARWARKPPSAGRVKLVFGVILLCVALFAVEHLIGWPAWLTPDYVPNGRFKN